MLKLIRFSHPWALSLALFVALSTISFVVSTAAVSADTPPQRKTFTTPDGVVLVADVYTPAGAQKAPAAILFHMLGRNRKDYSSLIPWLLANKTAIINVDLRGHGDSTSKTDKSSISFKNFTAQDWEKLPGDVTTVIAQAQKLPGIDGGNLVLIGSSIGANSVAMAPVDRKVQGLVLISPGMNYHNLQPEAALKQAIKPVLMVVGKADSDSARSVQSLQKINPAKFSAEYFDTDAHGNDLLYKDRTVDQHIATFVKQCLRQ